MVLKCGASIVVYLCNMMTRFLPHQRFKKEGKVVNLVRGPAAFKLEGCTRITTTRDFDCCKFFGNAQQASRGC